MLLKTKFLLSLVAIGVAGGTGVGISYLENFEEDSALSQSADKSNEVNSDHALQQSTQKAAEV